MAEIAFRPDAKLAALEERARKETNPSILATIREQIAARTSELMREGNMPAIGVGGQGYYTPQLNVYSAGDVQNRAQYERQEALKKELAGKIQLLPQGETGVYRAVRFNPDGTTTDISQGEGNKLTFFDASGNPLTATQVAQTKTGQGFANAGWDIGFGDGELPEGTVLLTADGSTDGSDLITLSTGNNFASGEMTQGQADRQSAYDLLYAQFKLYGLESLVEPLKGLITQNISPSEFTIRLRDTDAYKQRFSANQARINAGLRALSEAEYITLEDQYQDVMRRYGLPQSYYTRGALGKQEGFDKFISGDVSPAELEDRIQTAQNRVINAAPEVSTALKQFYPDITNGEILAYALDPNKAIEEIKRKVTAAEIGAGAMQAGLTTGATRAEELAKFGITGQAARQGYQTIASFLPRASQLSDIYKQGPYTQTIAESEVFGTTGAVEAEKRRKQLTELETAQFSGKTGAIGTALGRERAGQF